MSIGVPQQELCCDECGKLIGYKTSQPTGWIMCLECHEEEKRLSDAASGEEGKK